jgi:hypothetical protein
MSFLLASGLLSLMTFAATATTDAHAEESAEEVATPRVPPPAPSSEEVVDRETRWYGWQTLIADGVSLVTAPLIVGIITYPIAAPLVHAAHGRWESAGASLGIRVVAPLGLALLGGTISFLALGGGHGGELAGLAAVPGAVVGGALGVVSAIVIDAAVLAREPVATRSETARYRSPPIRLVPKAAVRLEGGVDLGVVGVF